MWKADPRRTEYILQTASANQYMFCSPGVGLSGLQSAILFLFLGLHLNKDVVFLFRFRGLRKQQNTYSEHQHSQQHHEYIHVSSSFWRTTPRSTIKGPVRAVLISMRKAFRFSPTYRRSPLFFLGGGFFKGKHSHSHWPTTPPYLMYNRVALASYQDACNML